LTHRDASVYDRNFHTVDIRPGSRLAALYPQDGRVTVNSIHHQAIKDLATGFVVEACCPDDGMIEAVRRTSGPYVAAVQWHPEFHIPGDPDNFNDAPMLRDFLKAARATRDALATA